MREKSNIRGILLVALSAASFGVMPILAKIAYTYGIGMYTMLFLRFLSGTVFMFLLMGIRRLPVPAGKARWYWFLMGAACYAPQSLCYFLALRYASAGVVALLFYIHPILVTAGSAFLFGERITRKKLAALLLALAGASAIIGTTFQVSLAGILFALCSAGIYTVYILTGSRVVGPGMGVQSSAFIMLGAASVYGILNLVFGFVPPEEPAGYIPLILIAFVSTVVAMWSFFSGMEITGPAVAALVSLLEPVVTVLLSVAVLKERLTVNVVIGGCLVLLAMIIISLPDRKQH